MNTDAPTPSEHLTPARPAKLHVIGIGASAGGLEALQTLFSHVDHPLDAAFIVVQHLSPDFKSVMDELLQKFTLMPIRVATHGEPIEAGHIYLNPPRKNLTVKAGMIELADYDVSNGLNLPIDKFFASLALDFDHRAVAVILSGTGSDGSHGIRAIKEAGGVIFVQDPLDAKFDGMPKTAIQSGVADRILDVETLADELCQYIRNPIIREDRSSNPYTSPESGDLIAEIIKLLEVRSGIDFSQYKTTTISRRIQRRIGINHQTSLREFTRYLYDHPQESEILAKELLIGVTRFFRDEEAFQEMTRTVIPALVSKQDSSSIRVWVAGCSTGEEAYSISIMIHEAMNRARCWRDVKIFATDIDENAIQKASSGRYSAELINDLNVNLLKHYFVKDGDDFVVSSTIRKSIIFAKHNILIDPPFSNMHLVTCRNLLIYLQGAAQRKVLGLLRFSLRQDGYLFLGSSESISDFKNHFKILSEKYRIFRKVDEPRTSSATRVPTGSVSSGRVSGKATDMIPPARSMLRTVHRPDPSAQLNTVKNRLIGEFFPPTVIINEDKQAVHIFGDVSPFVRKIQPGEVNNQLSNLLSDPLAMLVASAIHQVDTSKQHIVYKDVAFPIEEGMDSITVTVRYIAESEDTPLFYAVSFDHRGESPTEHLEEYAYDALAQANQRVEQLEDELGKKQDHLQVTVEELETTNEELQAANEELMAANEELQSTNEELQSVNEELFTVNSEYQDKIDELTVANNDLDGLIDSTDLGIIFLDANLTIRKFTEQAQDYFNLLETDLGRPFHHISNRLQYDALHEDVAWATSLARKQQRTVEAEDGDIVLIKINPFRQDDHHGGCVITATDVSQANAQLRDLNQSEGTLELALAAGNIGVWSWYPDQDTVQFDARLANLIEYKGEDRTLSLQHFLAYFRSSEAKLSLKQQITRAADEHQPFDLDVLIEHQQTPSKDIFSLRGGGPKCLDPYTTQVRVSGVLLLKQARTGANIAVEALEEETN